MTSHTSRYPNRKSYKPNANQLAALKTGREKNPRTRYSYRRMAQVIRLMMMAGRTVKQLAAVAHMSQASAYNFVSALHEEGCVHIGGYFITPSMRVGGAIYVWGAGDDVQPPKEIRPAGQARRGTKKSKELPLDSLWPSPIRRTDDASQRA